MENGNLEKQMERANIHGLMVKSIKNLFFDRNTNYIFCNCTGDVYEGDFKCCLKHGQGEERFANNDTYIGQYANGRPEG